MGFEEFLEDLKKRHPEWFGVERTGRPQEAPEPSKVTMPFRPVSRVVVPVAAPVPAVSVEDAEEVEVDDDGETEWWNL